MFYAIYFFWRFPMFYYFTEGLKKKGGSVWEAAVNSCACGMMVLISLDLCRVCLKVPFEMKV